MMLYPLLLANALAMPPAMEQNATLVLQVGDRESTARTIIARTEAMGGWFLEWNEWNITLRIPATQLDTFLIDVAKLGRKTDQTYSTTDQSVEIQNLQASIASRRKLLDSYFSMVKSSTTNQVQTIERAIVDLIAQIELDEGRLRSMQARIRDAFVNISFQFQDRTLPEPTGESPFPWLTRLNLTDHREDFQ